MTKDIFKDSRFTKKQYMDGLIQASGNAESVADVKRAMKKDIGPDGVESFFSNMPKGSFGLEKGDIADETIHFFKPSSKDSIEFSTKRAMSRAPRDLAAAKKRARVQAAEARTQKILANMSKEDKKSFDNMGKAALELKGNNKGGLAKKTKSYSRGGLTKAGHNDMRKGGLFK